MKRCLKCILPETAKGIALDQNGLCQFCRDYKEFTPKGEEQLRKEILEFICEKTKEYDCVVPVSGARDSAYALYYAKEVLGLKPLAVHNDNDFETEVANRNLETITKKSSVPIDCSLVPIVNYLTEQALEVSKIELGFSNMVRNGKMDRNDALNQVGQIKKNTDVEDFKAFLKELDVSDDIIANRDSLKGGL